MKRRRYSAALGPKGKAKEKADPSNGKEAQPSVASIGEPPMPRLNRLKNHCPESSRSFVVALKPTNL